MNVTKMMIYSLIAVISLIALTGIIGLLLPQQRIESRRSMLDASPETVYAVLTNNDDWTYRSDLKNLVIIERSKDKEIWDETSKNGSVIRFSTRKKIPYSFYSFDMQSKMFAGYWTAELKESGKGKTLLIATEYVKIKNPFIKTLSYLFFDLEKYMESYQTDLQEKLNNLSK